MVREKLPDYLKQGELARLFPVLSNNSKEGRTTSIVLACVSKVDEFGRELLASVGQKVGKRGSIETYTEIVFAKQATTIKDRPDGLVVLKVGNRVWRALVEAKVGNSNIDPDQVERYRALAKENAVDCVITISNQFATLPQIHPDEHVRKSRSKIPVFHWSWMRILTAADLLVTSNDVADVDQLVLLNELRRFLTHESAGVKGFDRMPKEWGDINRIISSGGVVPIKSAEAQTVLEAWHQETRDLSMILSRLTRMQVTEKLPRKHVANPIVRLKDELVGFRDTNCLSSTLSVPDAAAPIVVSADAKSRTIYVGMSLKAPDDRKSTKARLNWLLRQINVEASEGLHIRLLWPGASEPTLYSVAELKEDPDVASKGKEHLVTHGFEVFLSERLGARFTQQTNFIVDLERLVPKFYAEVGEKLTAWVRKAPRIQADRASGQDVSTKAIAEDAEDFDPTS